MDKFIVSARKYRPDTFDTVVGQASTTSTLKNAIQTKHLAQAYLFCGPRGVGKTTCARILAKTINCTNITNDTEACNECDSCKTFNENRSYNIHELDAASNNSVDDIRNLIDQVRIPPQVGKYSVYIIDEVHMLSQSAFNAFLKTLEEPPSHVIFILATTEKHKILPTILSRCQIYDFNRIHIPDIVNYLKKIAENEGVKYEEDALNIIAQKADGAMRDALSIFDQIVSFAQGEITYQKVIDSLNVLDYDYYFRVTEAMLSGDVPAALLLFDEILQNGFDGNNFINGLSNHIRDLLVSKHENTIQLLEVGEGMKSKYIEQSSKCDFQMLYDALDICSKCDIGYKMSKNQRLHVEISLIQICNLSEKKNDNNEPVKLVLPQNKSPEKQPVKETANAEVNSEKQEITEHKGEETQQEDTSIREDYESYQKEPVKASTPSIKDALKKLNTTSAEKNEENDIPDESDNTDENEDTPLNQSFTFEELNRTWDKYAEKIKSDSPRIYSILKNQKLKLTDETQVYAYFDNNAQMEEFRTRIKPELKAWLREKLNNYLIELNELIENQNEDKDTTNLYTVQDKFKHMVQKNPALQQLKQKFNLDFE